MSVITVLVPTYNEKENILDIYYRIKKVFDEHLKNYSMKLMFIDNLSTDGTRLEIEELCKKDSSVQAIFNATNFGFSRSTFYGLSQSEGDCTVLIFADMQDPPEVIPQMVEEWEKGNKIVIGIKNKSKESKLMYKIRTVYYRFVAKISEIDHINHFDGFGLYDRDFVQVLRKLDDPLPYLRGIIAEIGYQRKEILYEQEQRKKGKTHFNFMRLYDLAMLGLTSSSKLMMRFATFTGAIFGMISLIIALVTLILKLVNWNHFNVGSAAILIGIFMLGAIQLFFLGVLGEYVVNINTRTMKHPIVVEEKRINMVEKEEK